MVSFKEVGPISRAALVVALQAFLSGCGVHCKPGAEDCACAADEQCEPGLVCEERVCRASEAGAGAGQISERNPDGDAPPAAGGTGSATGAEGGRSAQPDDSDTPGAAGEWSTPGENGAGGSGDTPSGDGQSEAGAPSGSAGTEASGNEGGLGDSGTGGAAAGGHAGAEAAGGSADNGGSAGSSAGSASGGSENAGAGGTGGGVAGTGGSSSEEPIPFPTACWGCAIEGCGQEFRECNADATCAACVTTSYAPALCAENAAFSALADCFCNNFCGARCSLVCE